MKIRLVAIFLLVCISSFTTASEIKTQISAWSGVYLIINLEDENNIECYEIARNFDFKGNENHFIHSIEAWALGKKNTFWIYAINVNEYLQITKSSSISIEKSEALFLRKMLLNLKQ